LWYPDPMPFIDIDVQGNNRLFFFAKGKKQQRMPCVDETKLCPVHKNKEKQTVVPLNINIDEKQRVVVVSGPNAGGKSVCMKTVGLLQIMVQAGLLVPVDEHSVFGVFKQVFADIGDDQSIESDLSTYSAHLSKMKYFVENAGGKTLVLIDEFGTGTDPQFGGPIAEAVLDALNRKKIRGVPYEIKFGEQTMIGQKQGNIRPQIITQSNQYTDNFSALVKLQIPDLVV